MITKEQRNAYLYQNGLVDQVKKYFADKDVNISEEYYVLMADYLASLDEVKESMLINPDTIAKRLPEVVKNIQETDLGRVYGITDRNGIRINEKLDDQSKKMYFFHELTHALQTRNNDGQEYCGFYNGRDGMFLTEGMTQYTAEILYHVSNGTNIDYREQPETVRGDSTRTPYSPLNEYQYNGDILMLLSRAMDLPLPQVLALGYQENGRENLKKIYESMKGNQGKFDELMQDLEKIYTIDKALIYGYGKQLAMSEPIPIKMSDGTYFEGNLDIYKELMDKTERSIASTYIANHTTEEILQNYSEIAQFLTTPELKKQFMDIVQTLGEELIEINTRNYMENQSSAQTEHEPVETSVRDNDSSVPLEENVSKGKITFRQKMAMFIQKNNTLMKLPFARGFVEKQLNLLPEPGQDTGITKEDTLSEREEFMAMISNNGAYRNLPSPQISKEQRVEQDRVTEQKEDAQAEK